MDKNFWLNRWEKNDIAGFHVGEANPLLVKRFKELSLGRGARVFLPLCGKTLDIGWLLGEGFRVAGAEWSEMAVVQLFDELGTKPKVSAEGKLKRYSQKSIDIFVGDIFDLAKPQLGPVDAIYDRAALVALPREKRHRYAPHLRDITAKAPQLIICYEYDQSLMEGPPFSIVDEEVRSLYASDYRLTLIESGEVPGGLKGKCRANEKVWLAR